MFIVTFRNATGKVEKHTVGTRTRVWELAHKADAQADRAVSEFRVRTPSNDRKGPVLEDVTGQF